MIDVDLYVFDDDKLIISSLKSIKPSYLTVYHFYHINATFLCHVRPGNWKNSNIWYKQHD